MKKAHCLYRLQKEKVNPSIIWLCNPKRIAVLEEPNPTKTQCCKAYLRIITLDRNQFPRHKERKTPREHLLTSKQNISHFFNERLVSFAHASLFQIIEDK